MKNVILAALFVATVGISSCTVGNYNLSSRTGKNHRGCHGPNQFTGSVAWTRSAR